MQPGEMQCPRCGSPLTGQTWDRARGVVTCTSCQTLVQVGEAPRLRPEVPMPQGITYDTTAGGFRITQRARPLVGLLVLTTLFIINGFALAVLGFWQWMFGSDDFADMPGAGVMSAAGLAALVILGVISMAIAYAALALVLNRPSVSVEHGVVRIDHGRLPWPGNKTLRGADISQVFCRQQTHTTTSSNSSLSSRDQISYEVWVQRRDGRVEKILGPLEQIEQALFIEQQLERILEIPDQPVAGELPR